MDATDCSIFMSLWGKWCKWHKVICTDSMIGLCFNPAMQYACFQDYKHFNTCIYLFVIYQLLVMENNLYFSVSHFMKMISSSVKHVSAVVWAGLWDFHILLFFSKKMNSLKKLNSLLYARFLQVSQRLWFHHRWNQRWSKLLAHSNCKIWIRSFF